MASLPLTFAVCVTFICFLSSVHAAWIIDGNGPRQVDIAKLLEAAALSRQQVRQEPTCVRGDSVFRLGSTWTERCRECNCTEQGAQCTGPTCSMPYDSVQELTCAKFTSDGCCCAEVGCMLDNGTTIPVGDAMPTDPAKPCHSCTCKGGNRTTCLPQACFPYQCVDMVVREGQCCPDCPNGRTCILPYAQRKNIIPIRVECCGTSARVLSRNS